MLIYTENIHHKILVFKKTLRAGFEPARALPIGFRVQRLNHSAIAAHFSEVSLDSNLELGQQS